MHIRIVALLVGAFLLASSVAANAAMMFGNDDSIDAIQDIPYEINQGEPLFLAHRVRILYVGAGVYLSDLGYVLGLKSDSDKYYDLPAGDELKQLQADGLLPDPLPAYTIGVFDYLFGYSLWIVLAVVAGFYLVQWLRKKPPAPDATAAPPPA